MIKNEITEFRFARPISIHDEQNLPVVLQQGSEWVSIREMLPVPGYGRMSLVPTDESTLAVRVSRVPQDTRLAFEGHTPFTSPWRAGRIGPTRESVRDR